MANNEKALSNSIMDQSVQYKHDDLDFVISNVSNVEVIKDFPNWRSAALLDEQNQGKAYKYFTLE